ncbi:MAG: phosphatidate cytidylyltransferase [Prolixibacteraceae bacterium]|nr:phosphatidate cytidylyltransferase [Prolixibacteraceae bacterium]MBT6006307.1 phosphatidate cytidylyltransferase [Prolixibacteraceae bacterium]MBT6766592.1 phosphatidate cytidylyltransferase [Prolixibacteraceae bacterium]MBT6998315.1 phosphatidate cytidylyltransferase [Prolixibacteraceae bacterium]MBT7396439.1 phosphatidate cytidylyltransferase [Prolixibacteraceae bacterium]
MKDLLKRLLSGVAIVTVILSGTLIHPFVFAIIFASLLFFTLLEFYRLVEVAGYSPQKKVGLSLGLLLFVICFSAVYGIIPIRFCLLFIPFLILILLFNVINKNTETIKNSAVTLTGFVYVVVPFSLLNFIVYPGFSGNSEFYPWILAGIFFIIWIYDSLAYVAGSMFGKHKMAKNISPKKSWEGLIGGAIFAIIMGILNAVLFQEISMLSWVVIAIIVVLFGTFGDLFESKLKRNLGIKDSGKILPGHGGFLDRFDSFLFAVPVIYVWLILSLNI